MRDSCVSTHQNRTIKSWSDSVVEFDSFEWELGNTKKKNSNIKCRTIHLSLGRIEHTRTTNDINSKWCSNIFNSKSITTCIEFPNRRQSKMFFLCSFFISTFIYFRFRARKEKNVYHSSMLNWLFRLDWVLFVFIAPSVEVLQFKQYLTT